MEHNKEGYTVIDIMKRKNYFFGLSIMIILLGIAAYFYYGGFNLDIQFQGGTVIEMHMKDDKFDLQKVDDMLTGILHKNVTAQKSYALNAVDNKKVDLLIINIASSDTLTVDEKNDVVKAIREEFKLDADSQMTVRNIHPSIGRELLNRGLKGVLWMSVLIAVYVAWRFRVMSWQSGVFAVVGIIHDVLIMLAAYLIFQIPVNESFIAAVLTVVGYSMNDTVIIYDRIRENNGLLRKMSVSELTNKSIWQTLGRTINTTVTVLICLVTVYVFAVINNIPSIKEFSLPLIIGTISGTYSSIFISSPLWVMSKEREMQKKVSVMKNIA